MDKSMMDSLVNSSKRMAELLGSSSGGGGGDLPPLRLGLEAVEAESRRLLSRAQPQKQNDTKAAFLLAGVGVNVDELMRDVTDVNLVNTFEPLKPIHDTDIEGYLQHEHEQHIISAIEEGRRQTAQDFYKQMNNSVHASWAKQRARIFEDLLVHNPALSQHMNEDTHAGILKDSAGLPASRSAASFDGQRQMAGSLRMHPQMLRYYLVVERLHQHRKQRQPYPLATAFLDASQPSGTDFKSVAIQRLWQIVGKQVGEREVANGEFQRETVTERQYAQIYCMEVDSPAWSHLQQQIAQGSRAFLEDQFLQHMEREIMSRPVEAGLGGVPTIENKVRAYLNIKFQKESAAGLEMINNVPIWARLFYLLRAGHAQEAVNYACDPSNQLESLERNFGTYFKAWFEATDRRLPKALRDRFLSEYNARIRSLPSVDVDPFKQALYKLIGRVELNRRNLPRVLDTTEDWMWFQLCLVRDIGVRQDPQHEKYTLEDFSNVVKKFGEAYYDPKGNRPTAYAQVLLLCGQFEAFVDMMNKAVGYQTDSVHFALVLSYYGLLRSTTKSNTSDGELLYVDGKRAYINYCRLIYRYVRPISRSSAPEALQYLYTISFHSDYAPEHNAICKSYIKGLVVETSDSSALVGQILPNGDKREGQLQKDVALLPTDGGSHFLKEVINAAAERAEEEKRFSDAIHLYHLSEDYDAMISVLNMELGNSLSRPLRNDGMGVEDETLSLAKGILGYVQSSATIMANLKRANKETAEILIQLCDVLTLFERAEYQEALNSIRRLGVVPLDGDLVSIIRKADEFKELDPAIARNFDNVLLATMTVLSRLHEQLKDSPYGEEARQNQMAQLRSQGKALVMFASMLRYRMLSSDTFSELTRLDVSMR